MKGKKSSFLEKEISGFTFAQNVSSSILATEHLDASEDEVNKKLDTPAIIQWKPEKYFIRGPRKFLSDSERQLVWDTFKDIGKNTLTSEDIRLQIVKKEEFYQMFEALILGRYNGNIIGKQKAEQVVKSSFRSQSRKPRISASSAKSTKSTQHQLHADKKTVFNDEEYL